MPREILRKLFWVSLGLTLVLVMVMGGIDSQLRSSASPSGIVSFELCAYGASCPSILEAWGPKAQLMAALSLGADYLFMVAYSAAICAGLLLLVFVVPERFKRLTIWAARLVWVAGAADAIENFCLAQMLLTPSAQHYAWPAAVSATLKFFIVGITLAWLVFAYLRFSSIGAGPQKRGR